MAVVAIAVAAPARAATPSSVTMRGDATHDNRVTGAPEPPLGVRWALDIGAAVSYPVIAGGTVFVTVRPPERRRLRHDRGRGGPRDGRGALDPAGGRHATTGRRWPTATAACSCSTSTGGCRARALHRRDAVGDQARASTRSRRRRCITAGPSTDRRGSGMTAYAVRASDGALQWAKSLASGAGSPAVDDGTRLREHGLPARGGAGPCEGGDALGAREQLRGRRGEHSGAARRAACTRSVTTARSTTRRRARPSGGRTSRVRRASPTAWAYVPWQSGGIVASDAATWATAVDGGGAVGGGHAADRGVELFTGGEAGFVAALSRSNGAVRWCASTAGEPVEAETGNVDRPDSGLGAGEGVLLVAGRPLPGRLRARRRRPAAVRHDVGRGRRLRRRRAAAVAPPIGPTLTLRGRPRATCSPGIASG